MVPSYDYNRDTSPRDDDENSNIPNEISDYGVPFQNSNLGIGDVVEKCVTSGVDAGIKVAGAGLHIVGKILGGLF
jgi:hypothetical protein